VESLSKMNRWLGVALVAGVLASVSCGQVDRTFGTGGSSGTGMTAGTTSSGGGGMGTGGTSTSTGLSTSTGAGTGGGATGAYGKAAADMVSAGNVSTSTSYKMVSTMGQSTPNQTKSTSPKYRMQSGLVGAMGTLP
jgi:hypothetical protein